MIKSYYCIFSAKAPAAASNKKLILKNNYLVVVYSLSKAFTDALAFGEANKMNSTLTISPRVKLAIQRAFDMYYDKAIREGTVRSQNIEETLVTLVIGKYMVTYNVYIPYHNDECEEIDETTEQDECDCDNGRQFTAAILYKNIELTKYEFGEKTDKAQLFEWLDKIQTVYELCRCGELVRKDGWCSTCYIYRCERTEEEGGVCCVCLENEGRWIKLGCNHALHKSCYENLMKPACPLCRHEHSGFDNDPYLI